MSRTSRLLGRRETGNVPPITVTCVPLWFLLAAAETIMPAYLNTLIGFAVVMLVTSPLITILTQVAFGTAKSSREQSALANQDIVCAVRPERVSASLGEWRSGGAPGAHASLISDSWFSDIRLATSSEDPPARTFGAVPDLLWHQALRVMSRPLEQAELRRYSLSLHCRPRHTLGSRAPGLGRARRPGNHAAKFRTQSRIRRPGHMVAAYKTVGSTLSYCRPVSQPNLPGWDGLRAGMADTDAMRDSCARQTLSTESI